MPAIEASFGILYSLLSILFSCTTMVPKPAFSLHFER